MFFFVLLFLCLYMDLCKFDAVTLRPTIQQSLKFDPLANVLRKKWMRPSNKEEQPPETSEKLHT